MNPYGGSHLSHRIRVEKRPVDAIGRSTQHAVESDGVG